MDTTRCIRILAATQWLATTVLQAKDVSNFDHVKNDRSIEDADALERERADPLHHIKAEGMSEDMQRMMQKLHTPDAAKVTMCMPVPTQAIQAGIHYLQKCVEDTQ